MSSNESPPTEAQPKESKAQNAINAFCGLVVILSFMVAIVLSLLLLIAGTKGTNLFKIQVAHIQVPSETAIAGASAYVVYPTSYCTADYKVTVTNSAAANLEINYSTLQCFNHSYSFWFNPVDVPGLGNCTSLVNTDQIESTSQDVTKVSLATFILTVFSFLFFSINIYDKTKAKSPFLLVINVLGSIIMSSILLAFAPLPAKRLTSFVNACHQNTSNPIIVHGPSSTYMGLAISLLVFILTPWILAFVLIAIEPAKSDQAQDSAGSLSTTKFKEVIAASVPFRRKSFDERSIVDLPPYEP